MDGFPGKRFRTLLVVISALLLPGSGHVILGKPRRGLLLLMWMYTMGYIVYQLTTPDIPFALRLSGGFAVWVISVIEVYRISKQSCKSQGWNQALCLMGGKASFEVNYESIKDCRRSTSTAILLFPMFNPLRDKGGVQGTNGPLTLWMIERSSKKDIKKPQALDKKACGIILVEMRGIEPLTSWLPDRALPSTLG